MVLCISVIWCLVRGITAVRHRRVNWRREIQLLLVYICLIVVARCTFFPLSKVNGEVPPLVFSAERAFPFRVNGIPFVYLFDYPSLRDILLNVIGNTAMFIPLGIVWPAVYPALNTHKKVVLAGFGCSLCIEILQLPFYDRVSDIDDLILNTSGFILGYLIYLGVRAIRRRRREAR